MEPLSVVAAYPEVFASLPLRRYDGVEGWDIPCPVTTNHRRDDKRWSARLWPGPDRLRFWCGRGCTWAEATGAMGLPKKVWFSRKPEDIPVDYERETVARYRYEDAQGQLLFEVCRTSPKGFYQRRPGPDRKGWVYDLRECYLLWDGGKWKRARKDAVGAVHMPEVRRVPYRWMDIRKHPNQPILVVEGEKSADFLRDLGFVAICSPGGAGKWPVNFGGYLAERRVVIFPDNDGPGYEHAALVAGSAMMYKAASVRVVRWTEGGVALDPAGDVYDWLQTIGDPKAGELTLKQHRREAVRDLVKKYPEFTWQTPQKEIVRVEVPVKGRSQTRKGMKEVGTARGTPLPDAYTPESE